MTDTDKPVDEITPTEKPQTEETSVEEPAAEKPKAEELISSPTVPVDSAATPAGTDQLGRQLYDVKCADCGKPTQVPFNPTGDRPVYCRDCYMKHKSR